MGRMHITDKVSKITNLVILNWLVILTSLPVITAGASFAAMHSVLYRMARNEDGYIVRDYFRAWKQNFKKATILWFFVLAVLLVLVMDIWFLAVNAKHVPGWLVGLVLVTSIVVLMAMMYVFPLQAHFENTIRNTIKNSIYVMIMNFPKSMMMFLIYLLPVAAVAVSYSALLIDFFCGFSLPAYAACFLYRKTFERIE